MIDDTSLSDGALRLLLAMVKLAPRNGRNSDAVARALGMGKDKTNRARRSLREAGHWHARKRQQPGSGEIRDQRLASLVPLLTPEEVAAGWAAAEEAVRLGKDTAASRRLGVRIVNSAPWYRPPHPAAGSPATRADRPRPHEGDQTKLSHTPLPAPTQTVEPPEPKPTPEPKAPASDTPPLPDLPPLTGPRATYADQAEQVLLSLRRHDPPLPLTAAEAHQLAQTAGHHLLRGETRQSLHAVLTHALPPDGVRSPRAFLHHRLTRYLPPEPPPSGKTQAAPGAGGGSATRPPSRRSDDGPVEPDGPLARSRSGMGVRAVLEAATARDPLRKRDQHP